MSFMYFIFLGDFAININNLSSIFHQIIISYPISMRVCISMRISAMSG